MTTMLGSGFGGFAATGLAAPRGRFFGKRIVADAFPGFQEAGKEPRRDLAARIASEGMQGALDIAVRSMCPEDFVADHPEIVAERKEALPQN